LSADADDWSTARHFPTKTKNAPHAGLIFLCRNSIFVDDFSKKGKRFQGRDISSFKITTYEPSKKYFSLRNRKDVLSLKTISRRGYDYEKK